LLILAAVIVGVAIVLGINMFAQNSAQANQEAVSQDVLTIASRMQAWYRRPQQLGGGGRTFVGCDLGDINFPGTNANGTYQITGQTQQLGLAFANCCRYQTGQYKRFDDYTVTRHFKKSRPHNKFWPVLFFVFE
jgi:hypothetical protein